MTQIWKVFGQFQRFPGRYPTFVVEFSIGFSTLQEIFIALTIRRVTDLGAAERWGMKQVKQLRCQSATKV